MSNDDMFFVPTRCSTTKPSAYKFVEHESSKKVNIARKLVDDNLPSSSSDNKSVGKKTDYDSFIRQGRFDMFKFLHSKEKSVNKFQMDEFLAIRLGATPRKQEVVNYKEYKLKLREQKLKDELDVERNADIVTHVDNPVKKKKDLPYSKKRAALRKEGKIGGMLNSYGKVTSSEVIKQSKKKRR